MSEVATLVVQPALWDVRHVSKVCAVSTRTVRRLADAGRMPAPIRLSGGVVRWRAADVEGWVRGGCPRVRSVKRRGVRYAE